MPTGDQIIASARKYTGVPYFEGNPQTRAGMDCSGMIQAAMRDIGISISRTTSQQLGDANAGRVGKNVGITLSSAVPGDVLHYFGHEEIWLGNQQVFSESTNGTVASIRAKSPYPLIGIVRYSDGTGSATNAAFVTGNPVGDVINAVNPLAPFAVLFDGGLWLRIGAGLGGTILLLLALKRLAEG